MKFNQPMTPEQQKLTEDHMSLIPWTIRRYITVNEQAVGLGYEDLYQEGAIALCYAATTYRGGSIQFSTYAITVIRNHLIDYCRRIANQMKNMPTVSRDTPKCEAMPPTYWDDYQAYDETDQWISEIYTRQLLEHGKQTYTGVAKLGIEAMELKLMGYTGADIAKLYHTRPNHVGAWIARAASKLREDVVQGDFVEKYRSAS